MDRPALFYGQAWHLLWSCWALLWTLRRRVCPGRERRLCRQIYKQPFLRAGQESPELRGSSERFILAKATSRGPRAHYKMLPRGVCVALCMWCLGPQPLLAILWVSIHTDALGRAGLCYQSQLNIRESYDPWQGHPAFGPLT